MKTTWILTRSRNFFAPHIALTTLATAQLTKTLTPDNALHLAANIATTLAIGWVIYTTIRDRQEVFNQHTLAALASDQATYTIGAKALHQFTNPQVQEVRIRIRRGLHDDGHTYNATIASYTHEEDQ